MRFYPADPYNPDKDAEVPRYLMTDSPIAAHFLEEITKNVSRIDLATKERTMAPKTGRIKFRLMEADEVDRKVQDQAKRLTLRECDLWSEPERAKQESESAVS